MSDISDLWYFFYLGGLYSLLIYIVYFHVPKRPDLQPKAIFDLSLLIIFFGFVGARLLHVFYENPELYSADPWRVLRFWEGGFVWYGGMLAAIAACWVYTVVRRIAFLSYADFFAPIAAFGYAAGRVSCLIAGCCYGRPTDVPWAIGGKHPTPVYAIITEFTTIGALALIAKSKSLRSGQLFFVWLIGHGIGRLVMEHFRDDFRGPGLLGLTISSVVSIAIMLISALSLTVGRRYTR